MFETDAVIVGAGVIGLAVARALAMKGLDVIVLESESAIGQHTSSRNSEVIHAGIYYPQGSLKAQLCVEGRKRLYEFCVSRKVPFKQCGKLIVATSLEDIPKLEVLHDAGQRNGVDDLRFIGADEAHSIEPELRCEAALLSPSTGILDTHTYMLALLGEAEDHGARVALKTPFEGAAIKLGGFLVSTGGAEPAKIQSRLLINAAGLFATDVAASIEGLSPEHVRRTYWAKGNYFSYGRRAPFQHLIYPTPEPGGLGVHLTLDLSGSARFGPDVCWVNSIDYTVDETRKQAFAKAIKHYWPALDADMLQPGYSGIRPKVSGPDDSTKDFVIQWIGKHGVNGLVNLFGIESPGITASLAIAEAIASKISRY